MVLSLKPLFMGEIQRMPLSCELDFSKVEWDGCCPFTEPVKVSGEIRMAADVVTLRADVRYVYDGVCDRCAGPVHRDGVLRMDHILVVSLNDEENDSFILIDNYQLPLDELVEEDLLLDQPTKILCREECKGLCPHCGKDLNEGPCACHPETVDPRLAILKELL